jgi:uncharacterized protein (DUF608 family)
MKEINKQRISEIAFYEIYTHLKRSVPNEKLFLFIESLSRIFSVDYTSLTIAITQFVNKIKPTKKEKVILAMLSGVQLNTLGVDYRTIRSYRSQLDSGSLVMQPRIINRFLVDELRKFVIAYLNLFVKNAEYLHQYKTLGGFDEIS